MPKLTEEQIRISNDSISNIGAKFALTTIDNPYDPFTQYHDWLMFDESHDYCTNQYLARIALTSEALSEAENNEEIERAIDEIIRINPLKIYKKVINKFYKENV